MMKIRMLGTLRRLLKVGLTVHDDEKKEWLRRKWKLQQWDIGNVNPTATERLGN